MVPPATDEPRVALLLGAERAELERAIDGTRSELDAVREARADA